MYESSPLMLQSPFSLIEFNYPGFAVCNVRFCQR